MPLATLRKTMDRVQQRRGGKYRGARGSSRNSPRSRRCYARCSLALSIVTFIQEYIFMVSRCIPLYPAVSRCILHIPLYPAVSCHILPYPLDIIKSILQSMGIVHYVLLRSPRLLWAASSLANPRGPRMLWLIPPWRSPVAGPPVLGPAACGGVLELYS